MTARLQMDGSADFTSASFSLVYCIKCLTPNTRPNGFFDSKGLCGPCKFADANLSTDFNERLLELQEVINPLVGASTSRWDCIVGVSGGKDSTRQAIWTRDVLGLNPLLVSVGYPDPQMTTVGAANLSSLVGLGFDCLLIKPSAQLSRQLVRGAFLRFANWARATEMTLFAAVPRIALDRGIKLILWGENPALQVGDHGTIGDSIWDGSALRLGNTLSGGNLDWFRQIAEDDRRLAMYQFPTLQEMSDAGVRTIFLGPAWADWSNNVNTAVSLAHGFQLRENLRLESADAFGSSMVDEDWFVVNHLVKYFKFGFSRGTEQANSLIREGKITRGEGVQIAKRFDGGCDPQYIRDFCIYIDITESGFWQVVREHAHPYLFSDNGDYAPKARFTPGTDQVFSADPKPKSC